MSDSSEIKLARLEERQLESERWRERTDRTLEAITETLRGILRIEAQNDTIARDLTKLTARVESLASRLEKLEEDAPINALIRKAALTVTGTVLFGALSAVLVLIGLKP